MFENKNALRIISLVAAVLLWFYVMGEVDPDKKAKISNIPVYFTNVNELADEGLAVVQEEQIMISAMIKGARSDVNDIKKSGLTAYIDVSDADKGKNEGKISINIPSGVNLESISDETAEFIVEELVYETKPVEIEFDLEEFSAEGNENKVPWVINNWPDKVEVSGAVSSVKKVVAVKGMISAQEAREDKVRAVDVAVQPVDKKGTPVNGPEIDLSRISAEIQLLTVKSVNLEVVEENLKYGMETDEIRAADKITVAGSEAALEGISKITATADLAGIKNTGEVELKLNLPENIYFYDDEEKLIVTVTLKSDK